MGTIPGPIVQFSFSAADLAGALQPALADARRQTQTVTNGIADDWKRLAAQIRASLAQGLSTDKEITQQRQQLLTIIDRQISGYNKLAELSKAELTNLKALTLERERQASFLKGTGGLTAGTSNALGQVFQQTILGIGRVLDSLVNRYLGGAAGAAFRTARDLQYYGSIASSSSEGGSTAAGGGILAGLRSITAAVPEGVIAVGGFAAALTALAAAGFSVTKSLAETAQSINNTSASTGLSTTQVQVYGRLASESGLDPDALTNAFARLQAQVGEFITKGKSADESTQNFIRTLNQFGIKVTDSAGNVRNISDVVSDFAGVLQGMPDRNKAAALSLEAFGVRGKILADIINQATNEGKSFQQVLDEIGRSGIVIPNEQLQNLQKAKTLFDELWRAAAGQAVGFKLDIANQFLSSTGVQVLLNGRAGPEDVQKTELYKQILKQQANAPQSTLYLGTAEDAKARVDSLLKGNEQAAKIEELRKQATQELEHGNYVVAISLAQQVSSLEKAVALEKQRAEMQERVAEAIFKPRAANVGPSREQRSLADLYGRYSNGPSVIPGLDNAGLGASNTNYLTGIIGPAAKSPLDATALLQQINKEHEDLFKSQAQIDAEHYQDELDSLNEALHKQLISQQEYNDAVVKLNADRNKTLNDANKKFEDEAGSLFEDLISGKTKNFTQGLLKDVENIALAPVKQLFEQLIGQQFNALAQLFTGKPVPGQAGAPAAGGGLGGVFGGLGGILGKIGLGGTPGWWPGAVGNGPGGGVGQTTVSTNVMDVRAQIVNIASLGIANSGGSGGIGGVGNFFGGSLLGQTGNFFGNLNPFGSSGSTGGPIGGIGSALGTLQNVFNKISPYAAGAATLGIGIATGNEGAMAIGAATLASKAANALSSISSLPSGLSNLFSSAGAALPGIGLGASGIIGAYQSRTVAGKIGGTLEAGAGGALAGLTIGGPIGAAIGGAIGLIGGGIASLLGGNAQNFQQSVVQAMARHQYIAPPSENFSFASNGSIAQTLGTGFFQSGSDFQQYALPANTPFYASALTGHLTWQQKYQVQNSGLNPNAPFLGNPTFNPYVGQGPVGSHANVGSNVNITLSLPGMVDVNNISDVLKPHVNTIASLVSNQVSSSASGWGSNARKAVFLP